MYDEKPVTGGGPPDQSLDNSKKQQLENKAQQTQSHEDVNIARRWAERRFPCPHPRRIRINKDGDERLVRCHRPTCIPCRRFRDHLTFFWIRAKIGVMARSPDPPLVLMCDFNQPAMGTVSARSHKRVQAAISATLQRIKRPRSGTRKATPWPGLRLEYVRQSGMHRNGVLHYHCQLFIWPLPDSELPTLQELEQELKSSYWHRLGEPVLPNGGRDLIYLRECESQIAAARYITTRQEPPPRRTFPKGHRRRQISLGLLCKRDFGVTSGR